MLGVRLRLAHRDLMRPERAFHLLPVDDLGSGPSLWASEDDHRPGRPLRLRGAFLPRVRLDAPDLRDGGVESLGHRLVHRLVLFALDEPRCVAEAAEHRFELFARHPRKHRRPRDLRPVQVKDREHRAVPRRVEEFVRMP